MRPQGVVFNVNYFNYFDVAMTEFHREVIGKYDELVEAGADMVVAEARARYMAPARFDEELDIEIAPVRLGDTSLTVQLRVQRGETLLVEGELRYVFIEAATKRKCRVPDDIRRALVPYMPT